MKAKGLKGTTDALAHCATMKKGGPAPMIRSMKSYQMGGSSNDSCMEEYVDFDGKRKKRRKKSCSQTFKSSGPKREYNPIPNRYRG